MEQRDLKQDEMREGGRRNSKTSDSGSTGTRRRQEGWGTNERMCMRGTKGDVGGL